MKKNVILIEFHIKITIISIKGVDMTNTYVKKLGSSDFNAAIQKGVVLVDFFAEWCPPCKIIAPILDDIAQEMHGKVSFYKVDIDQANDLASESQVTSIPTLVLFKNGKEVNRAVGARDKRALVEFVSEYI